MTLASKKERKSSSDPAPRKRRRRTVVTGARDDCFTCARQRLQCDRNRPFCSQCLDRGLECSGYKTTLTWGVGVASRGKLRGLAVPIRESGPPASSPESPLHPSRAAQSDSSPQETTSPSFSNHGDPSDCTQAQWLSSGETARFGSHSVYELPPAPVPHSYSTGTDPFRHTESADDEDGTEPHYDGWTLAGCVTRMDSRGIHGLPGRVGSSNIWMIGCPTPSFSQLLLARSVGHSPRLRYLISYYSEVIAPMIIAFDSPTNPFRTCILRLAEENIALQEAIAALSVSNIRRRRERKMMSTERTLPAKMSSRAHQALADADSQSSSLISNLEDLAREEHYHRGRAVSILNSQLADHHQRLSDSVLATLLILCLFHGCDTGVAQFKTQYAGVMKLLAIRMRTSSEIPEDLKWFIRVFTWYDTMTAITNDREAQLRGVCLQIASSADSERGLEILTGCDTQIFRYVAQLGRLNFLSQNREVTTPALSELSLPSAAVPPSMAYAGVSTAAQDMPGTICLSQLSRSDAGEKGRSSMSSAFWAEWFSLRQKLVSWRLNLQASTPACAVEAPIVDVMGMNPSLMASREAQTQDTAPTRHLDDVYHISECFRHAAMLYTERLAHPHLPSSHPQFQTLVDLTMQHIAAVKSDVYLLWPLFIAGSECVLESHRSTIRQRCRDIARDSGFLNNISCLEVLERIWLDDSPDDGLDFSPQILNGVNPVLLAETLSARSAPDGSNVSSVWVSTEKKGLRWHKAMKANGAGGEYMVV